MVLGLCLLPAGIGAAMGQHGEAKAAVASGLSRAASEQAELMSDYFARARSINLLVARNPAFRHFYELPGTRIERLQTGGPVVEEVNAALRDVEDLFRDSISEACFIDRSGAEVGRMVRSERAALDDLSLNESKNPFFAPTLAMKPGEVHQSAPYLSMDTNEWVIANATPLAVGGTNVALVHFEVSLESFRRAGERSAEPVDLAVVDATTGAVIIDSRYPQQVGGQLGRPGDTRFKGASLNGQQGTLKVGDRQAAFQRIPADGGNVNDWYVAAVQRSSVGPLYGVDSWTFAVIAAAGVFLLAGAVTGELSRRHLMTAATTDQLTSLGNRRALIRDMPQMMRGASLDRPLLLTLFDLNGFKAYNDSFGHPAGDALLSRLGAALATAMAGRGRAYRLGGDEFCVLAPVGSQGPDAIVALAQAALSEEGAGFHIDASHGTVLLPEDTRDAEEALRIVDQRMYANKRSGRRSADQQSKDVLIRALHERRPELRDHSQALTRLVESVTEQLGMEFSERQATIQAAELHHIGTVAIPDAILHKQGALTDEEQKFLNRASTISERIIAAAPALTIVAHITRSAQEHYDGTGAPDLLRGDEIPLGSRVLAVCAAYVTLTEPPPPGRGLLPTEALTELHRHAGTKYDPHVVRITTAVIQDREQTLTV
jgi:diguanylate cyclase (GGDEF)-like protein